MAERLTIAKAINRALADELREDDKVILQGEDIGPLGGVYRITENLVHEFGADRVVDSPLAESGIIGTSIGLAYAGYRPVPEIQFDGFVFPAFDQITTQLAKIRTRSHGTVDMPVTIRLPYGGGIGSVEHHGESPESLFAHTAGLRVATYSSSHDAYWMTRAAIQSNDPFVLMEPKRRYYQRHEVDFENPGDAANPFTARIARAGTDATVIAWGAVVGVALSAAEAAAEEGRNLEVIDIRSISPIDFVTIEDSVKRTGRAVIVQEAPVFGGICSDIAARLSDRTFLYLQAPVQRVGGAHIPYPPSMVEADYLPDADKILDAVDYTFTF